jgi:soluble lytic murein transglycosylase-like protein
VSPVGARGYMQVMPFWTRVIGDGDASKLFHMQTNLRFGCVILRHYIDREKGDLFLALGRYNGSRGKPQYPNAVFAASKNWDYHALAPTEKGPDPTKPLDKAPSGPN